MSLKRNVCPEIDPKKVRSPKILNFLNGLTCFNCQNLDENTHKLAKITQIGNNGLKFGSKKVTLKAIKAKTLKKRFCLEMC